MADTNIKFLKENNLYEAHKHFMQMVEGYGYTAPIEEDGPDDQDSAPADNGQDMGGGQPPMGNGGAPQMGGAPDQSQGGAPMGDPNAMGGADPNAAPPADGQPPMGDDGSQDPNAQGMDGGMPPMDDGSMPPPPAGDDAEQSDDDVIDVDDIVKAQIKTNDKVNDVGQDLGTVDKRIEKLLGALEDMQGVIDKNNAEIADLKSEFEKRNPTQTEKLNLRSLDSYPFNVKPTDYWQDKSADSNYQAYSNNSEPTTHEYEITNDDVDDIDSDIDKTFDIPEDDIQDFKKIFNM